MLLVLLLCSYDPIFSVSPWWVLLLVLLLVLVLFLIFLTTKY